MFNKKFSWQLDLNCASQLSEATALPTEPQPLPQLILFLTYFDTTVIRNKINM